MYRPPHPEATCRLLPCIEWGTVADWVTAGIALLALLAAVVTAAFAYSASAAARRQASAAESTLQVDVKTRSEAQARKVYVLEYQRSISRAGDPAISLFPDSTFINDRTLETRTESGPAFAGSVLHLGIEVVNGSDEIVGPISVQLFDSIANQHSVFRYEVTAVLPGVNRRYEVVVEVPDGYDTSLPTDDMMPGLQPVLEFRDSAGQWWSRRGIDPIQVLSRGTHRIP